jgi:predicted site-specific integrase-resolvase
MCSEIIAFLNIAPISDLWITGGIGMRQRKRVALYLRVSTSEQTTKNQRRELLAVAKRHNWQVVAVASSSLPVT